MKTLDQIFRYTTDCRFSPEDWEKVLQFCRERFRGGKIHKSKNPIGESTYQEFINWFEDGKAAGDFVSYGNTMGIISRVTPDKTILGAYCDYGGNLIVKDMEVRDRDRLQILEPERVEKFRELFFENGKTFYPRSALVAELYRPEKYFYVYGDSGSRKSPVIGIYLESDDCNHHFVGCLIDKTFKIDCWVKCDYTPLRLATREEIVRFHKAASEAGYSYSERLHQFSKTAKRGMSNVYYYLNERFEMVKDRDDGSRKHELRFKAGNYILDQVEALNFMRNVLKLRGKA